jgi:aminocarboxymuconate-semialdehyde decarboxylase
MQRAIDIHSHMLSHDWLDLLRSRGGPRVTMKRTATGEWIHVDGAPFMLPVPAMFDYEARLRSMDGAGTHLVDPQIAPVWEAIDRRALPVFVHPTVPCGCAAMGIDVFQLTASIGFTYDSTLAVSLMIHTGFFDRYPRMKLIMAHGGGTLTFLAPRLDRCFDSYADCRTVIEKRPSTYLRRLYVDSALFSTDTLRLTLSTFGDDHVLYGTDSPHGLSDMEGTLARIAELDAATRDKVRGANAERLFGIPAVPHSP